MEPRQKNKNKFNLRDKRLDDVEHFLDDDFAAASADEKKSMVNERKSISYWRDAWRRFRTNKVAMAALVVFLLVVLFSFAGPSWISYNYKDQYRSASKLGPLEHSAEEEEAIELLKTTDAIYDTSIMPGSLTSLKPGDYSFKYKGKTYGFTVEEKLSDCVLLFDKNSDVLLVGEEEDYENGSFTKTEELPLSEPQSDANSLKLTTSISPHMFGTDSQGRDLMARCMYGSRVSIIIGIVAALIVLVIGSIYGAISGLLGGWVDFILMRIIDIVISIPSVLMVLLLQVVIKEPLQQWFDNSSNGFVQSLSDLGVGIVSIFITFALLYWVSLARIVRGQVLQLKQQEFVTAAKALGANNSRIIRRHLLPNCVGQLVVATCLQIPSAIFMESFLSFLGMGVSAPMASLGSLCSDAIDTITQYPYRMIFPAVILTIIVLTLNLIGDGLRDALDPRMKK